MLYSEEADYTRTIVYSDGNSGEIRKDAVYLYKFRITENGVEKEKIADFPMMNVSWDETGERLYFMNADEIRDSGDSPVYVYNGESVSEVSPGLRAECFGFIYEDAELTGEIGYLTEEEIWNGTYHILDLSDGSIRQEQLDEYVPYEQEDTRIISEGGDPEIVRHLKDNELCVSFGGDTVSLGPARYFDTIGDHILYIPEEAQSDGWTMVSSSFLRADRMELKAYVRTLISRSLIVCNFVKMTQDRAD